MVAARGCREAGQWKSATPEGNAAADSEWRVAAARQRRGGGGGGGAVARRRGDALPLTVKPLSRHGPCASGGGGDEAKAQLQAGGPGLRRRVGRAARDAPGRSGAR